MRLTRNQAKDFLSICKSRQESERNNALRAGRNGAYAMALQCQSVADEYGVIIGLLVAALEDADGAELREYFGIEIHNGDL